MQQELDFSPPVETPSLAAFPFQHQGRWHAVYWVPGGRGLLHSIGDALTEGNARKMADNWNRFRPVDHAA